jgi:hypothetical protein
MGAQQLKTMRHLFFQKPENSNADTRQLGSMGILQPSLAN